MIFLYPFHSTECFANFLFHKGNLLFHGDGDNTILHKAQVEIMTGQCFLYDEICLTVQTGFW